MNNKTPEGLRLFVDMVSMGLVARKVINDYTYTWEAEIKAHEEMKQEVERLRIGLMHVAHAAGQDPGGMTHPDHLVHPDIVEYALAAVRELRELYSEALEET